MNIDKSRWQRVKFGDVVRLNTERSADPAAAGVERYVGLEHIDPEDLRIRRWGFIKDGTTFTNYFRAGQVLFGKRRAYQHKVAVAHFEGVCSSDIYVFEPKDKRLLPELLPYLCQTEGFYERAVGTSAGSLSPRTSWTQLANYEFLLPPVDEQIRISDVLSRSQMVWTALENAVAMSRQLSVAVVTSLLDSSAAIGDSRTFFVAQLRKDSESVLKTGPFGSRLKTSYFKPMGVPIISIGALAEDGLNAEEFFHLDPRRASEFDEYKTLTGDIVFSRVADVGRCHLISETEAGFIISSNLIRIRVDPLIVMPAYLWLLLKYSTKVRRQLAGMTTQAAGRLLINTKTMNKLSLEIPSLSFQEFVVAQYQNTRDASNRLITRYVSSSQFYHSAREQLLMVKDQ